LSAVQPPRTRASLFFFFFFFFRKFDWPVIRSSYLSYKHEYIKAADGCRVTGHQLSHHPSSLSLPSFCVFGYSFWFVVCSIIRRRRRGLYIRFDCVTETAVAKYDETSREGGQEWSWCQQDSRPALTLTETNFYFISFLFHKNRREIERGKTIDWLDRHTL
jgi:hypothetical protein